MEDHAEIGNLESGRQALPLSKIFCGSNTARIYV